MTFLLAANWKMNPPPLGWDAHDSPFRPQTDVDVVVFPSALDVRTVSGEGITTGSQGAAAKPCGACTGEISMKMIEDAGCTYVLCGHSERRASRNETDDDVAEQVIMALEFGLRPIVCIGETADERKAKKVEHVLTHQLKKIPADDRVTIAYEPLWAIGTGNTPEPRDIQEVVFIVKEKLKRGTQRFLYGGSFNAKNCEQILKVKGVDGALIGGASLKIDEFGKIVEMAVAVK